MNRNIDISQEEFEEFDQYFFGQMLEEEKDAFRRRLAVDKEFQDKFETARLLFIGVQEAELSKKLDDFHRDLPSIKKNRNKPSGKIMSIKSWYVAASIVLIVGLGTLLLMNKNSRAEKIFAAFYRPDPGLISAMSSTSDSYVFDRAMIDYKIGKYDLAIKSWESLLVAKPENDTLNYFIGSAYLARGEEELAFGYFKKVIANPNSYFLNDARWYTGLVLLRENKIMDAVSMIEKSEHQGKETLLLKLREMK